MVIQLEEKSDYEHGEKCPVCWKPVSEEGHLHIVVTLKDGKKMCKRHFNCIGSVHCEKCDDTILDPNDAAQLISPYSDRTYQGFAVDRIWLCRSCYDIVIKIAKAKLGVDMCS